MCTKLSTRDSAPALTWKKAGSLKKGAESPDPEGAGLKVWSHLLNYSYQSMAGWRQADTQAGLWEAGENTNREVVWLTLFHASLDIWGCVDYNTCSVFPVILSLSPFELNKLSATMLQTLQLQLYTPTYSWRTMSAAWGSELLPASAGSWIAVLKWDPILITFFNIFNCFQCVLESNITPGLNSRPSIIWFSAANPTPFPNFVCDILRGKQLLGAGQLRVEFLYFLGPWAMQRLSVEGFNALSLAIFAHFGEWFGISVMKSLDTNMVQISRY